MLQKPSSLSLCAILCSCGGNSYDVAGRVLDTNDKPIEDALVVVSFHWSGGDSDNGAFDVTECDETNSDGEFSVSVTAPHWHSGPPENDGSVTVRKAGYWAWEIADEGMPDVYRLTLCSDPAPSQYAECATSADLRQGNWGCGEFEYW